MFCVSTSYMLVKELFEEYASVCKCVFRKDKKYLVFNFESCNALRIQKLLAFFFFFIKFMNFEFRPSCLKLTSGNYSQLKRRRDRKFPQVYLCQENFGRTRFGGGETSVEAASQFGKIKFTYGISVNFGTFCVS